MSARGRWELLHCEADVPDSPVPVRRSSLCLLGFHKYDRAQNDDGEAFLRCRRCEKIEIPNIGLEHGGDAML